MKNKNILIAGGGTGGHLYPAVAVIEYIRKEYPETSIVFIGSRKGSGRRLITEMGVEFYEVRARGLAAGGNILKKAAGYLMFFWDLIPGFFRAFSVLRKKKIGIVLGMGGYICAPVFLAAITRKTGFAIHEQNYIPGRLNRMFSGRARYVFTSFEDTGKFFKQKRTNTFFSGNPVRDSIKKSAELAPDYGKWGLSDNKFTITAFGGSLGARSINETILELGKINGLVEDIQVLLISGERFYESITGIMKNMLYKDRIQIKVYPYIDEIEKVYRITDLIIARAGANTVFETAAAGIPSILIPYPFAIDDHQSYNARYLEQHGIAVLMEEKDLGAELLKTKVNELLRENRKVYKRMKNTRMEVSLLDSAKIISEKLVEDIFGNK